MGDGCCVGGYATPGETYEGGDGAGGFGGKVGGEGEGSAVGGEEEVVLWVVAAVGTVKV